MPRSRTTASQNHAMSSTERRRSCSAVEIPCVRMNRETLAASTTSSDGLHTIAIAPAFPPVEVPRYAKPRYGPAALLVLEESVRPRRPRAGRRGGSALARRGGRRRGWLRVVSAHPSEHPHRAGHTAGEECGDQGPG